MRPSVPPTWVFLPASSSMCARSIPTRTGVPSVSSTSTRPSKAIGSSYWEIWKFFGMSG